MITIACTQCRNSITASDDCIGKSVACPRCGTSNVIDKSAGASVPRAHARPAPAARAPQTVPRKKGSEMPRELEATPSHFNGTLRHLLVGAAMTTFVYAILFFLPKLLEDSLAFTGKFTQRSWPPYVCVLLSCWSLSILGSKWLGVLRRRKLLSVQYLPESTDLRTGDEIDRVIAAVYAMARRLRDRILGPRIGRALEHFRARRDIKEVGDILQEESDAHSTAVHTSYALVRVFLWTIPVLGFIGTVMGVSSAIGGFAGFLARAQAIGDIQASLGEITTALAVAFDTTYVALILSVVVMIVMSAVEKAEQEQLAAFDDYCQKRLLRRLSNASANQIEIMTSGLREALRDAMREGIPSIEAWQRTANEFTRSLIEDLCHTWKTSSGDFFAGLKELVRDCEVQYMHLHDLFEQMGWERRASQEEQVRLVAAVQNLLHSEQENLRLVVGEEQKAITEAVQRQHSMVQQYGSVLLSATDKLDAMLTLQYKLEEGLLRAAGSDGLIAVLKEVRGMLQNLEPMMQRLAGQPLDVAVRFVTVPGPNGAAEKRSSGDVVPEPQAHVPNTQRPA